MKPCRVSLVGLVTGMLFVMPVLAGCAFGAPHLPVFQGNYAFGQGDFHTATVSYLRVSDLGDHADIVHYNLGNVYYALGEIEAALDAWEHALNSESVEVQYRTHFNKGLLLYETGRYSESYQAFRNAVRMVPQSIPAKLNLELAYERMSAAGSARAASETTAVQQSRGLGSEHRRILEFVRRREVQSWQTPEQSRTEESRIQDW